MKKPTIPPLCILLFSGLFLAAPLVNAQQNAAVAAKTYDLAGEREGSGLSSNVPLNEINIHAFRHFRRDFPRVSNESWFKTEDGYIVSFMENARRHQVHYAPGGAFLYTVEYYDGAALSPELGALVEKAYPAYAIDIVTAISDGDRTFYLIKIESRSSLKTLLVNDGKLSVYEDLVNGK